MAGVATSTKLVVPEGDAPAGIVAWGSLKKQEAGGPYLSVNDDGVKVTLEENGSVRAVVCAHGNVRSDKGERLIGFMVRMPLTNEDPGSLIRTVIAGQRRTR